MKFVKIKIKLQFIFAENAMSTSLGQTTFHTSAKYSIHCQAHSLSSELVH